ncbi:hypothetical protein M011DRAFT_288790 [Sporormia fimetaria CBS 119925]|uniref:Uncharacterized protein n=1 Tax=Sporormia fimetaria CBS 119925 TaxID=1340428 RepID=A0A6A6UZH3_9PLEO|nr:hypothetical protein M011DRAFT_288790 [Sporormia fimetaria CBS 119925]
MQSLQQLCSFPAAEGLGRSAMEEVGSCEARQETYAGGMTTPRQTTEPTTPPAPPYKPSKVEKRTVRASSSIGGPYLRPLPTIETLMSYDSMSRPLYNSMLRGEPPARNYKTVIHTPKPQTMRILDDNLLRSAEITNRRRRKRANSGPRMRSNTGSSTASSTVTAYSASSSIAGDSESGMSDITEPSSPASVSSTSKATIASSPPTSPQHTDPPRLPMKPVLMPVTAPSIESDFQLSDHSGSPSSPKSYHSTASTLSWVYEVDNVYVDDDDTPARPSYTPSTRSSAPSPTSTAYPSPPSSPAESPAGASRRSSSSHEEFFMYPSPPATPYIAAQQAEPETNQVPGRLRRAFSSPSPPGPLHFEPKRPALRRRSASLNFPTVTSAFTENFDDSAMWDLGEQRLGGGGVDDEFDAGIGSGREIKWSMNGGEIVVIVEEDEEEDEEGSVYGSKGRKLWGECCPCDGKGLGLYVIDEEEEVEMER